MTPERTRLAGEVISSIQTRVLRLPLQGALRWGQASELLELEHVLVEVQTECGVRAVAEAPVRPTIYGETIASIREAVEKLLAPRLLGRAISDPGLAAAIGALPFNHAARGALDTALHLARATTRGASLVEGVEATRDRAEASFILGIDSQERMIHEAERVVAAGVKVLKVKVGRDQAADEGVLKALSFALDGSGVRLYADANQSYSASEAPGRLSRLAKLGVIYVEEPLPVQLLRQRAELRMHSPLPIIADDSCFTPAELERELDFDTFDILNIKPARTGISSSLAMMRMAAEAGKGVMIGSQASSGLGTVHAAALALRTEVDYPSELAFPLKLRLDSLERPLQYVDGYLQASEIVAAQPARFLSQAQDLAAAELE